jgi:hypothetical protein
VARDGGLGGAEIQSGLNHCAIAETGV